MKKLLICCFLFTLTGCNMLFMKYDNNEYGLINKVRTIAQQKHCDEYSLKVLYLTASEMKNYSEYLPNNQNSIDLVNDLFKLVDEIHNRKQPISAAYCDAKLNIIALSPNAIGSLSI